MDIFKILRKKSEPSQAQSRGKEALRSRFEVFKKLLASNNNALEIMADMSEKLSGEYLFDRIYIEQNARGISDSVKDIVVNLNKLSGGKYSLLSERFNAINTGIEGALARKYEIPEDSFIAPFSEITKDTIDRFGGKNANLGELKNRVGLPVPEGFAISSYAFKKFMEHNGFLSRINEELSAISIRDYDGLAGASGRIRQSVLDGDIPADLREAIGKAAENLESSVRNTRPDDNYVFRVSVRSSALHEDTEYSFAGQYHTSLNVPSSDIIQRYKEVVASLFTPRAIYYFKSKGIEDYDMVMSVGVLKMVDARAGGVIYTTDPNNPEKNAIIISSVHGLGKCVVDGTITPEIYIVSRDPGFPLLERQIHPQRTMLICRLDGGLEEIRAAGEVAAMPSLSDKDARILAGFAIEIENHYKCPQDIEWAIDREDNPFILQARPLRILSRESQKPVPSYVEGYDILINKGVIACKGVGSGKVCIVRTDEDIQNFPEGAVLVARHTSPKYVMVMNKASAIVTDFGGTTGHMASLAREFQVPAILDTEIGTKILSQGQEITVDAFNCNIYRGRVDQLIELARKREEPFRETQIFRSLKKVVKLIVPLNLVDPNAGNFKPEYCRTFHDITRFCHEMAVRELFDITGTSADEVCSVKLTTAIPIDIYLLDLGGGIKENHKSPSPENLSSPPFVSFLKGLSAMKWPEGRPFDAGGFFGAVARTATISEADIIKAAEKNFCIITGEYMNFAIRLGYHLSTVEAYAGDNINDNYIRFFFKGGGAQIDRRLRRVRLISEILKKLEFHVKVTEDVISASVMKYRRSIIINILERLGKLTVYTKQLDMVMYNDSITDFYIEEFVKAHVPEEKKAAG